MDFDSEEVHEKVISRDSSECLGQERGFLADWALRPFAGNEWQTLAYIRMAGGGVHQPPSSRPHALISLKTRLRVFETIGHLHLPDMMPRVANTTLLC